MVTPKIIKVLYVLFTIWTALIGLIILVIGFRTGGMAGGLFTLIIVEPIFLLLTLGIYRVVLEAFMVIFRIYDEMKKIRENTETEPELSGQDFPRRRDPQPPVACPQRGPQACAG